ncbi:hypothetical protein CHUAL_010016 [Chamberlinius hualienensis]
MYKYVTINVKTNKLQSLYTCATESGIYNRITSMENSASKTVPSVSLQELPDSPEKTITEVSKKDESGDAIKPDTATESVNGMKRELDSADNTEDTASKKLKLELDCIKRKKVAMLLSYCGHGYMGMQRNPNVKTIEEDLLTALLNVGLITQEHFDLPQSMNFQRAARTDKGVSAARQVVSLRIALGDNLKDKINDRLPPCIRVQSIIRTTKRFNSKFSCDARTYSYTLPTYAFAPVTEITTEDYRINESVIQEVNEILKRFKGTHNLWNFTSGRKFDDASSKRYIMHFECGEPFIEDGLEIVVIKVKGQSFMLHQIRKMIGITIAITRGMVHYDYYNKRYSNDGIHEPLQWDSIKDEIEEFKRQHIYLPIIRIEKESKSMINWLATLPNHTYDVRQPSAPDDKFPTNFELARRLVVQTQTESEPEKTQTT